MQSMQRFAWGCGLSHCCLVHPLAVGIGHVTADSSSLSAKQPILTGSEADAQLLPGDLRRLFAKVTDQGAALVFIKVCCCTTGGNFRVSLSMSILESFGRPHATLEDKWNEEGHFTLIPGSGGLLISLC